MFIRWWPQDNTSKCLSFSNTQHNPNANIYYTNRADWFKNSFQSEILKFVFFLDLTLIIQL